jgi:predicted adenylyl cyclase CyaB
MRNIELKARCSDLARAGAACERLGARRAWTRRQVDTYFAVGEGRLKLREEEDAEAVLVSYQRADAAAARESHYELTPVRDVAATLASLAERYGVRARVEKTRTLYLLENVRIHLDDVAGLGTFVEFEAVMDGRRTDEESRALLRRLSDELGIEEADALGESYGDMGAATS